MTKLTQTAALALIPDEGIGVIVFANRVANLQPIVKLLVNEASKSEI